MSANLSQDLSGSTSNHHVAVVAVGLQTSLKGVQTQVKSSCTILWLMNNNSFDGWAAFSWNEWWTYCWFPNKLCLYRVFSSPLTSNFFHHVGKCIILRRFSSLMVVETTSYILRSCLGVLWRMLSEFLDEQNFISTSKQEGQQLQIWLSLHCIKRNVMESEIQTHNLMRSTASFYVFFLDG